MNFLAHCFLSGDSEDIMIGNFIADSVRGNKWEGYSPDVCRGIKLHRLIDQFTDTNPIVKLSKGRLYDGFGKYAAVIVDMFYDHLLAVQWEKYSKTDLRIYTQLIYRTMRAHINILPAEVIGYLPIMEAHDWLFHYKEISGIEMSLKGLSQRSSFPIQMDKSVGNLKTHYTDFLSEFNLFFPQLIAYVEDTLQQDEFLGQC